MMDCKKALTEAGGDPQRALELLRKAGAAKAAKRVGRSATEGKIKVVAHGSRAAMVEVLSETDFVSRSEEFEAFANRLARALINGDGSGQAVKKGQDLADAAGGDAIAAALAALRVKVGENVQIGRGVAYQAEDGGALASYVHFSGGLGVLLEVSRGDQESLDVARSVAMHIAASDPQAVTPEDLDSEMVERERKFLAEQALEEGKPASIAEKIVTGRMRKFFEQHALTMQTYALDQDQTVGKVLAGAGLEVRRFARFEVGR